MQMKDVPFLHLTTVQSGPLHPIESTILNRVAEIEAWFRTQWKLTPAPLTSSVDLRQAGFKLAPVDTNLFPAGFNNLNPDLLPLCVQAAQSALSQNSPGCTRILIIPESHTRNQFYMKSLYTLQMIFIQAGFLVRIGSLDPDLMNPMEVVLDTGVSICIEPIQRQGDRVGLSDFSPCIIVLNNDLSSGIPEILQGLEQPIRPTAQLGWSLRLKSNHFQFYNAVAQEFSNVIGIDDWSINPYYTSVEGVDFMAQQGIDKVADAVDLMLNKVGEKYASLGIKDKPFAVVKADNGTYGMSVMTVHHGDEFRQLNRKQRTKMASAKGGRQVDKVLIQEGVYTFEKTAEEAVAEPVVYMMGPYVIGGFYRVHQQRGIDDNLNAPGMHFEPLAFSKACNTPCYPCTETDSPNRFYVYGVIARLAALAAAREIAAVGD